MTEYAPYTRSSTGACVQVRQVGDEFLVTSSVEGNDGAVTFDATEWAAFGKQVKDGLWDDMFQAAEAIAPKVGV